MKRVNGPTPNGGVYSEIYYCDKYGNKVEDISKATQAYGCEFDQEGKMIQETHFVLNNKENHSGKQNISPKFK